MDDEYNMSFSSESLKYDINDIYGNRKINLMILSTFFVKSNCKLLVIKITRL